MIERTESIRRRRGSAGVLVVLAALSVRCGGAPPTPSADAAQRSGSGSPGAASVAARSQGSNVTADTGAAAKEVAREKRRSFVTPSKLLPDLVGQGGVVALEDGHRRTLVDRMRIIAHEDGSLERAAELLPHGQVTSQRLPSRLGGGFLFHAASRGGTQIWRSSSWLGKLEPVAQLSSEASDVIPGFDRLYVRLSQNNRLLAVDVQSGEALPLGPLPLSGAYGQIVFADGWRAVVEADLQGLLATFDAGTTWRPVRVEQRPSSLGIIGGDPALMIRDGYYVIDARGNVTLRTHAKSGEPQDEDELPTRPPSPLGRRPLRAAIEDGWPDGDGTAVVARGGVLARVSLADGAVLALAQDAYRERQASCHAVRLGNTKSATSATKERSAKASSNPDGTAVAKGSAGSPQGSGEAFHEESFGFICGERDGATIIYEFRAPLAMRELHRFQRPRFVASSGNGSLVVRGPCGDEAPQPGMRTYCVLVPDDDGGLKSREIRVKAASQDIGVERVVALADGRVVVLVPPRTGIAGQITLLEGNEAVTRPLALPAKPRGAVRELRRGMWLEGFEEREPGVIGGWIEAGGPIVGVEITVADGRVKAGEPRHDPTGAILAGRFAVSLGEGDVAAESTDGGMTWQTLEVPERAHTPGASPTRACGPAGCVFKGWMRVGWGPPAHPDDLEPAKTPPTLYTPLRTSPSLSLSCTPVGASTPPLPEKPAPTPPSGGRGQRPPHPRPSFRPIVPARPGELTPTAWSPFRNTLAPPLSADEIGFDNGAPFDIVSLRAYVWGKKGADWGRAGRWMVRFDDRFDPAGGVRSSAVSTSPWPDETAAAEGMGGSAYGVTTWGGFLDPGGRAAMVQVCRGAGCDLFAVVDGQPILQLRDGAGRTGGFLRPLPHSAVRAGETWFFLTPSPGQDALALWRADLGAARLFGTYDRPARSSYSSEPPRLVRRASGSAVGLMVATAPEPGTRTGTWVVLPVDPTSGTLGEAIALGRKDLSDMQVRACAPGQDGWVLDAGLEAGPIVELGGSHGAIEGTELRLRLDPGTACVDAVSLKLQAAYARDAKGGTPTAKASPSTPSAAPADLRIPLAATERLTGKRWGFRCEASGPMVVR
ncbi:hypothetical protein [Chondromyces crocatus]|nr:hypothetical protein [Chondromyces crocatus]